MRKKLFWWMFVLGALFLVSGCISSRCFLEAEEFMAGLGNARSRKASGEAGVAGKISEMDEDFFSAQKAREGLWTPEKSLDGFRMGVHFLEPYASRKIPVLFIYGAGGRPGDWNDFVGRLDRNRFQPWFFHYPTGLSLSRSSRVLADVLQRLWEKHGFGRVCVAAHSQGGLVGMRAVQLLRAACPRLRIPLLITLSTPWDGHKGAALGCRYSPVVIPSWKDVAHDSRFLHRIREIGLPAGCDLYLFFAYKEDFLPGRAAGDGVFGLDSQLEPGMQWAAKGVFGVNRDHRGIMHDKEVLREFVRLLNVYGSR